MWKSGHHDHGARVTILASHSVPAVPPLDEKNYVAMTVTGAAIRKIIEFATPNAVSELLDQNKVFIKKG